MSLPLTDLDSLLVALVETESVSGDEAALADLVEASLLSVPHLQLGRDGNAIWAKTDLGRDRRLIIAGHLDTVPVANNLPSRVVTGPDGKPWLWGRGTVDMKAGLAIMAYLATSIDAPACDVTWVFYDCEEIEADRSGLGRLAANDPSLMLADLAILMEPTDGAIEGGCQGSMRFQITTTGLAAHSGRGWLGHNAIHDVTAVLNQLLANQDQFGPVVVDGLEFREGLNATTISGGLAGNVIPDSCTVQMNYRFAPSLSPEEAEDRMRQLFDGLGEYQLLDLMPGARPGLDQPIAKSLVEAVGGQPKPKYGWTDVARFSALGTPAINFGPGDPALAHSDDEAVSLAQVHDCAEILRHWLSQN